jgi:hypothetical protein
MKHPCPHKHEIVFEGGLSEVPGIGTIFALLITRFHVFSIGGL